MNHHFSDILVSWYIKNKRNLPWRETKDPYKIWLSEIILQQTRVVQGLPYYLNFVKTFPTVEDLASAEEQQVLRLWQGLGYYSRARNLHACAKMIVSSHNGKFPKSAAELKKLKGIGDYTSAAIASFCFKEVSPVLDGNVFRVIARYFGIQADIADAKSKKEFYQVLNQVIDPERPDLFNQAIMEFGALHCTPANPACMYCDLQSTCFSFENKTQSRLPVKSKKIKVKEKHFQYLIFTLGEKVFMKKRGDKGIWAGLYDFFLLESKEFKIEEQFDKSQLEKLTLIEESKVFKHVLTHQVIWAKFFVINLPSLEGYEFFLKQLCAFDRHELIDLPKPKLIDNYLKEYFLT